MTDAAAPTMLGRYRLLNKLAQGGMATLYLAQVTGPGAFQKVVAIKTIQKELLEDPENVSMFIDEARIASAIDHPNVCQVFDFGEEQGTHYLVMEYLVGEPLARVAKKLGEVKSPELNARLPDLMARVFADAAEGLHAAHELKDPSGRSLDVIHRDVSPQNVIITYDGTVKVVDFGIAKARERLVAATAHGLLKGKPPYVAPEQVKDVGVTRAADVWALAVCLWELVTLKKLFPRDNLAKTMGAILKQPIEAPSKVAPWVPPELDAVILSGLERDAAKRPSAREFGRALRGFLTKRGVTVDAPEVGEFMRQLFPDDYRKRVAEGEAAAKGVSAATPPKPRPTNPQVRRELEVQPPASTQAETVSQGRLHRPAERSMASTLRTATFVAFALLAGLIAWRVVTIKRHQALTEAMAAMAAAPAPTVKPQPPAPIPPGHGRIRVTGEDPFDVYLDGAPAGISPLTVDVRAGAHQLEVRKSGAESGTAQPITIEAGREYGIEAK